MDRLQTTLSPKLAGVATDKLWQFQLRKENKALLDQIQENERRRQFDTTEADRKLKESTDRITALESRLAKYEREKTREDQARRDFMKEDAAFKTNLKNFLEGRVSEVELSTIMGESLATRSTAVLLSRDAGTLGNMPASEPATSHHFKLMPATILPTSRDQEPAISSDTANGQRQKAPRNRPKPTIARRPVTRSRIKSMDSPTETAAGSPHARLQISNITRLSQGTNHIKTYYNESNDVFKGLSMNEAQQEVDFVSAFISGITDPKIKNRLIAELQQLHPSRNRKDGRIEVLCDWDDIPDGLKKAGLLSPAKETSR
ncbi:hypothetical protein N431DRAFT_425071 [Stipitochalara longipes BDJ]|nr:hypothetical protein N431DRAFT_425071 [Stipitochalara longipes BDJ]